MMRDHGLKRQRESEIAMGEALEGDFRKAMRTLASAVSIVSTAHDGRRFGMTATAVCSLSMQPPTLLVCVNQSTSLHHPVLSAGRFCINILHADQDELARTFGRKGIEDRFASGNWQVDDRGVPFVADAQASIFCAVEETYGHRTHSIVVGAVYRAAVREAPGLRSGMAGPPAHAHAGFYVFWATSTVPPPASGAASPFISSVPPVIRSPSIW